MLQASLSPPGAPPGCADGPQGWLASMGRPAPQCRPQLGTLGCEARLRTKREKGEEVASAEAASAPRVMGLEPSEKTQTPNKPQTKPGAEVAWDLMSPY